MEKVEQRYCKEFGDFLKESRIEAGLTQKEIAKKCGHNSPQFISNIERGLCWPPMNVLIIMSDLYKIPKPLILEELTEHRRKVWASQLGVREKSKKRVAK